jgi:hypothetical protein
MGGGREGEKRQRGGKEWNGMGERQGRRGHGRRERGADRWKVERRWLGERLY